MQKFSLRPLTPNDFDTLFQQQLDPQTASKAGTSFDPTDRAVFDRRMQDSLKEPDSDRALYVVEWNGTIAGSVGYFHRDQQLEVCYWLGPEFRGQGLATRALAELMERLPGGRQPVYARVVDDNYESVRVLEKCGFESAARDRFFSKARGEEVAETVFVLHRDRDPSAGG